MFEFFNKNKIKLNKENLVEKYKDKSELPTRVRLDACIRCQLACPACDIQQDVRKIKQTNDFGFLSFKNFKKFIDKNDFIKEIELSNRGEIFLNPELVQIMKYADEKGVRLTANNGVNLNYLTDEQAEALVKYNFDSIVVSIDGASQEIYQIYRVGGDYNKVLENIRKILDLRKKFNKENPKIIWKYIVFGHNEHEIPKAKEEAKRIGVDDLIFDANYEKTYSPIKDPEYVKRETGLENLDRNITPAVRLREYLDGKTDWYFCRDLWEPQINWDGQILGCCANYMMSFGGNAFKDGLLNALNSPDFIYAKNMVTNKAPQRDGVLCTNCWCYGSMKENNIWLKSLKRGINE